MTLAPDTRLGPYEIVAPLGAGGMGEVYRAQDTRLGRAVAVKVLPADVAGDPERLRRFAQEARAASALQHPNLLTVFDVGSHDGVAFLVTELLQGESLRALLRRGPLEVKTALEIAQQLARGLAAAHEKGIVHRDLKPDNVFVSPDGTAKILDFGLARIEGADAAESVSGDDSTVLATAAGSVLGTAGYMAPEQVRGGRADARSDLFALGVVVCEMLTGANPFRRDTAVETHNAILTEVAPPPASLPATTPPGLDRLLARLLEKEPERRFHSAHDLGFALESVVAAGGKGRRAGDAERAAPPRRGWWIGAAAGAALVLGAAIGLWWAGSQPAPAPTPLRFEVAPPAGWLLSSNAESHDIALAPDGRTLAYSAQGHGITRIFLHDFDSVEARPVAGSEGGRSLFWSPDGRNLAFFAGGKLKRVPREGGAAQVVCEVQGSTTGAWGSAGTIVFSQGFGPNNGLFSVPAAGGAPTRLESAGDLPRWIDFLPDGRRFLYWDRAQDSLDGFVYVGDLDSGRSTRLLDVSSQARYAAPGWLLYIRSNTLVAQRFDPRTARPTGDPVALATDVPHFFNGWAVFSAAGARALAYQVNPPPPQLIWFDRHGRELERVGPSARHETVRLAPDGRRAVTVIADPATAFTDLWVVDLERGGSTRLTDEPFLEWSPVWSPDGQQVAYTATSPGPTFTIRVRQVSDGARVASLAPHFSFIWPRGWAPTGLFIDRTDPQTAEDVWLAPALDAEPVPILRTEFREALASPSPDGRWLAFYSTESGRGEIELMRPEAPGRRVRVSDGAGGVAPRWRADGRELYYVSAEGWLTAIEVRGEDEPSFGEAEPLFELDLIVETGFDVAADGQRFLVAATAPASSLPVVVTLGWQAALPGS